MAGLHLPREFLDDDSDSVKKGSAVQNTVAETAMCHVLD